MLSPALIRNLKRTTHRAARRAVDVILPPRCLACGTLVDEPGNLCPSCFEGMRFIAAPLCRCCGLPFDFSDSDGQDCLCGNCLIHPHAFDRARAVFVYDAASRPLILAFKHADRTDASPAFARWMARAGQDLLDGADLLVPVPLHRWRLLSRRYNQAALLARHIGKLRRIPAAPRLLTRIRATASQGVFNRSGRFRNVKGAFRVARPAEVAGKAVVLIDDVRTTGATVDECARVLKQAGARRVDVLTLAQVI